LCYFGWPSATDSASYAYCYSKPDLTFAQIGRVLPGTFIRFDHLNAALPAIWSRFLIKTPFFIHFCV
jgi:hypothetical protein